MPLHSTFEIKQYKFSNIFCLLTIVLLNLSPWHCNANFTMANHVHRKNKQKNVLGVLIFVK